MKVGGSHVGLLGELDFSDFLSLGHHVLVLDSHDSVSPLSSQVEVVVVLGLEGRLEVTEISQIFLSNVGQSNAGGVLGVAKSSESGLGLNEGEWNLLLSAKGWQMAHDLDWVDIVSHNDKLSLSFFNEGGDMVKTVLEGDWLGTNLSLVSSLSGFSLLLESSLLLGFGLW